MASSTHQLHFVLFPLMASGHMIPMVDIARLLAQHGMIVTIVTTPHNAARFAATLACAIESGLQIRVVELQFPAEKAGLPEGCENFDSLPSLGMALNFFTAATMLQQPAEEIFQELSPRPSCIISDICLYWTSKISIKYQVPRISFTGCNCFCLLCLHNIATSKVLETVTSEREYFVVPGLPDHIELTKCQLMSPIQNVEEFNIQVAAAEQNAYGMIMNSFEELEGEYARNFKETKGEKVWCIGPVSLCNQDNRNKVQRGNIISIDEHECLKWLHSWNLGSVLYVCLGSQNNLVCPQMIELGLALEALDMPFIWVLRGGDKSMELGEWITDSGFEERIKGRGLVIQGWAPQLMILEHPAIGGFLTHCGWNSTLEAISAGVPMVTWPLFADQFCNGKLVVELLKIGVSVGVEVPVNWGLEEQIGVLVRKEDIIEAVNGLMKDGEEKENRKERAKRLAEMARNAVEEGGSSYRNIKLLIKEITEHMHKK